MYALTLTQPWASLVAIGAKQVETRSWSTRYRGPLAIHAARGLSTMSQAAFRALCAREPFSTALQAHGYHDPGSLPRGAIVAVVVLVDVVAADGAAQNLDPAERAFGDYRPGRWAWLFDQVRRVEPPMPARGKLGLWRCGQVVP